MTRSVLVDREPNLAVRSYRGLLPLLPQDFRHAYGTDVVETFREMVYQAQSRGSLAGPKRGAGPPVGPLGAWHGSMPAVYQFDDS